MNRQHAQRGAATLVTVMILFILIAMVAAFASRNMVIEQRIATNYYRSDMARETAEAGAEWTMAMLNGIATDGSCLSNTSGAVGANSFRQRYLSFGANRAISMASSNIVSAACVRTAANTWSCQCPSSGTPLQQPSGLGASTGLQPAFDVQLEANTSSLSSTTTTLKQGIVRILVTSCTGIGLDATWGSTTKANQYSQSCTNSAAVTDAQGFAIGYVTTDVALVSALKMPPATPLVALGNVDAGSPSALGLHNSASSTGGLLMQIGGTLTNTLAPSDSLPGALVSDALITSDPALQAISSGQAAPPNAPADLFFERFFGMPLSNYETQPAIRGVTTTQCGSDCSPQLLSNIANGMQMMWLQGPATLATNVTLGSAANPVVIVVDGDLTITAGVQIYGLLYVKGNLTWVNTTSSTLVDGVVISGGNVAASGSVNLVYDANVVNILNNQRGSFVRVPGSWIDQYAP